MENAGRALLAAWESYYVIVGSSAAALTGLQFVVIALAADKPNLGSPDSVAAFGTPTVVHFCVCLFVAAGLSVPWPTTFPVMWLLFAAGAFGEAYTLIVLRRARRQDVYRAVVEDWIWHTVLPFLAYGVLIAGALLVRSAPVTGMFLPGAATILLIFVGIHNAWDAVAYIAIQPRKTRHR